MGFHGRHENLMLELSRNRGSLTVDALVEQSRLHNPYVVILLENKNKSYRYKYLIKVLQMDYIQLVEPKGIGGGLCVFWKEDAMISIVKSESFFIELGFGDDRDSTGWRMIAVYASTAEKQRRDNWQKLGKRISYSAGKCLLIGYFNEIVDDGEKEGGNYRSIASTRDFRGFLAANGLIDLGFVGYPFTWRNKRDDGLIQQRLDRGVGTSGWIDMFPRATITHVALERSDHSMLVLSSNGQAFNSPKRFYYDSQ